MAGYQPQTLKHAKQLRRDMTPQERLLWNRLRDRQLGGYKFRKQQPIGPYIVDFICHEKKLIVEADGSQHYDSGHDLARDQWLKKQDYSVLRYWNNEINENLEGVLEAILVALSQHPSPTSPKQ
jgi:very-short-patch-repair endonuclease